jgi:hypothetical protein
MEKKPYKGKYPSAAHELIRTGFASTPRQLRPEIRWAEGIDIVYTLKNMTPANFQKYADVLLLLAYQEAMRYDEYKMKFAKFDVRLGKLKKGRDLPDEVTFQAHMHPDSDTMVYGPGYEVPQEVFLYQKTNAILDIAKRYGDRVNKQAPYKVVRLTICIRQPIPGRGT